MLFLLLFCFGIYLLMFYRNFTEKKFSKLTMKKKTFEEELYQKVSLNDLILFSIFSAAEKKGKCTFEELVKECFVLFPKSFSFSHLLKWPDSRKLDRPLRSLRKRKLITGDPKTLFSLTKLGKKRAEETTKIFRQRKLKI